MTATQTKDAQASIASIVPTRAATTLDDVLSAVDQLALAVRDVREEQALARAETREVLSRLIDALRQPRPADATQEQASGDPIARGMAWYKQTLSRLGKPISQLPATALQDLCAASIGGTYTADRARHELLQGSKYALTRQMGAARVTLKGESEQQARLAVWQWLATPATDVPEYGTVCRFLALYHGADTEARLWGAAAIQKYGIGGQP